METPAQRLCQLLADRPLTVTLPAGLERRLRLYADRLNQRLAIHGDPYHVEQDQ